MPPTETFSWGGEDPRLSIYKRAVIVILAIGLSGGYLPVMGSVETKNGWSIILTGHPVRGLVSEDDGWPIGWLWCRAPERR